MSDDDDYKFTQDIDGRTWTVKVTAECWHPESFLNRDEKKAREIALKKGRNEDFHDTGEPHHARIILIKTSDIEKYS